MGIPGRETNKTRKDKKIRLSVMTTNEATRRKRRDRFGSALTLLRRSEVNSGKLGRVALPFVFDNRLF